MNIFGIDYAAELEEKVQNQSATPGVTDFAGVLEQNGVPVATTTSLGAYLPLAGGTMAGTLDMATNTVDNLYNCMFANNGDIVTPPAGYINVFQAANKLRYMIPGGGNLEVATTAGLAAYLPLAGGTMAGTLAMGSQAITGTGAITGATFVGSGTTPATSTITGALQTAGGLGVAGSAYIGGKAYIAGNRPVLSGGFSMITDTTIGNTTTETSIIGAGVGTLTVPANTAAAGNSSRIDVAGTVTITVGVQTLTLRLYGGPTSTLLLSTYVLALQTLTGGPPPWRLQTILTTKSIGVAGTVRINTVFTVNDASPSQTFVNNVLATVDTTVNNVVKVTAQWTTANAANIFVTSQFTSHSLFTV